jgi:hypothetical protein
MARAVTIAVVSWAMLAAACTDGGGAAVSRVRRLPALEGTILATGRTGLVEVRLPSAATRKVSLAGSAGSVREAFWGANGDLYALTVEGERRTGRLYRIAGDGSAVQVGPAVEGVRDESEAAGVVAVATCGAIKVLDVSKQPRWREAGRGCGVALSPNAKSFAFTGDGSSISERRLAGGPVREVVALRDLRIAGGGYLRSRLGAISWGGGGLAFQMFDPTGVVPRTETFVRTTDGRVHLLADWSQGNLPVGTLRWEPGGRRLAYNAPLHGGGVGLAIFDTVGGSRRIVAVQQATVQPGFLDYAWSPDGNELAAVEPSAVWLFVDLNGDWIKKLPTGGFNGMFAWSTQ